MVSCLCPFHNITLSTTANHIPNLQPSITVYTSSHQSEPVDQQYIKMSLVRTFESDPNFMILLYAYQSLLDSTDAKPDYNMIKMKTGLVSAAAA